ncbi:c-type cytochrome [Aliikangiella sp. G2MR2-5]|uniref:c-type cytochrome n=1 Tax=Aliikangiella sp. G2MR2-5 TaxID=2788943 RepID=UPI0018A8973E|nr:c-type cytochrome [Aliikangiella sp. G2MR2-5]
MSYLIIPSSLIADSLGPDYQTCVACHGDKAQGNEALGAPALAGLADWYLERQLIAFKEGTRGSHAKDSFGAQMKAISASLSTEQIKTLTLSLSQLNPSKAKPAESGDSEAGKKYYLSNCAACHSNNAAGNQALNSPSLLVQSESYLIRQLEHFRQGIRGSDANDKFGRQMAMMAKTLPDEQAIRDVVAYIKTL